MQKVKAFKLQPVKEMFRLYIWEQNEILSFMNKNT